MPFKYTSKKDEEEKALLAEAIDKKIKKLVEKLDQQNAFIRSILIQSYIEAPKMFENLRANFEAQLDNVWVDTDTPIIYTDFKFVEMGAVYMILSNIFDRPEMDGIPFPAHMVDGWHYVVQNDWTILMEGGAINSGQTIVVPTEGWEGGVQ